MQTFHTPKEDDPRFAAHYEGHNTSLERFIPNETRRALDVGCGHGGMAAWLSSKGIETDGVSWNPDELASAKAYCKRTFQCDLNVGMPCLSNAQYDLVICSHLLEHIAYPQTLLRDAYNSLNAGGTLLVAIPNVFFWRSRAKLIRGEWPHASSGTFDYTHVRWYTWHSMMELLSQHNFVVEESVAEGWIPLPGLKYLTGARIRQQLNALACRYWPGLFGNQLIYRARKPHAH